MKRSFCLYKKNSSFFSDALIQNKNNNSLNWIRLSTTFWNQKCNFFYTYWDCLRFKFGVKTKWKNYIKKMCRFYSHPRAMINRNSLFESMRLFTSFLLLHLKMHEKLSSKSHQNTINNKRLKFDSGICLWWTIFIFGCQCDNINCVLIYFVHVVDQFAIIECTRNHCRFIDVILECSLIMDWNVVMITFQAKLQ